MQLYKQYLSELGLLGDFENWYMKTLRERNKEACKEQYSKNKEKRLEWYRKKQKDAINENIEKKRSL